MSGETIEEWAAKRAHQLDAEGWRWVKSSFYGDELLGALMPWPEGATVKMMKAALLAERDKVAALVNVGHREHFVGSADIREALMHVWLRYTLRVVDDDSEFTDFGHEIRRVLLADGTTPE